MDIGQKIQFKSSPEWGYGEVVDIDDDEVSVVFLMSPSQKREFKINSQNLDYKVIPEQSTCYWFEDKKITWGRVDKCTSDTSFPRRYFVKPANRMICEMNEDEFHLRGYCEKPDVLQLLSHLETETPYFFENRSDLVQILAEQKQLAGGMNALAGSRIRLYNHQLKVCDEVLKDHRVRYLLADEVGLGKTIETGMILTQLLADEGSLSATIFVPDTLVEQWEEEIRNRFQLPASKVKILDHSSLLSSSAVDIVVIDEAHRLLTEGFFDVAKSICSQASSLLLLTATPVVRSSADLFWLLHLLEPKVYPAAEQGIFMSRFERRREIGRFLRSLQSANQSFTIKRTIGRVIEVLENDTIAAAFTEGINTLTDDDLKSRQDQLIRHISETYRIHRRMQRTRRKWIIDDVPNAIRSTRLDLIEDIVINDQENNGLWEALDAWRIEIQGLASEHEDLIDLYFQLASSIAGTNSQLKTAMSKLDAHPTSREDSIRQEILKLRELVSARNYEPVEESILEIVEQTPRGKKIVIFCSDQDARSSLSKLLEEKNINVFSLDHCDSFQNVIDDFRDTHDLAVLLCNSRSEEGLNLQFAHRFIHYDLPMNPMRIEQRIGRVDRVVHTEKFSTRIILSSEEEDLPVDWAWFCLLKDGFKIFQESVSDIPFLLNDITREFRSYVFENGPNSIDDDYLQEIKARVASRREENEDQDIIDGLHSFNYESEDSIISSFKKLESKSVEFQKALGKFAHSHLKLRFTPKDERRGEGEFVFKRSHPNAELLIDSTRTSDLLAMLATPSTTNRELACQNFELDFLRPGSSTIEKLEELLSWDIRGKAYAMWRPCERFLEPTPVFRFLLKVTPRDLSKELNSFSINKVNFERMAEGFYPPFFHEIFIDSEGNELDEELTYLCNLKYKSPGSVEINLGGKRRDCILSHFGKTEWIKICESAGEKAIVLANNHEVLKVAGLRAKKKIDNHFAREEARMKIQRESDLFSPELIDLQISEMTEIKRLIDQSIIDPQITVEIAGAYVLSEKPFWKDMLSEAD